MTSPLPFWIKLFKLLLVLLLVVIIWDSLLIQAGKHPYLLQNGASPVVGIFGSVIGLLTALISLVHSWRARNFLQVLMIFVGIIGFLFVAKCKIDMWTLESKEEASAIAIKVLMKPSLAEWLSEGDQKEFEDYLMNIDCKGKIPNLIYAAPGYGKYRFLIKCSYGYLWFLLYIPEFGAPMILDFQKERGRAVGR